MLTFEDKGGRGVGKIPKTRLRNIWLFPYQTILNIIPDLEFWICDILKGSNHVKKEPYAALKGSKSKMTTSHKDFGNSVNPNSTRGEQIFPTIYYLPIF